LNQCGVQDIRVVTGYKKEAIELDGISLIENKEYKQKGILHSVMEGLKDVEDNALILYADLVFDKHIIDRLLTCKNHVNLVVDMTYRTEYTDKAYDLVVAQKSPVRGKSVLSRGKENLITKIGRGVRKEDATHEFVGIAYLSKEGVGVIKREFEELKKKRSKINNVDFDIADFSDLFQEMINKGIDVGSMEIAKGWKEIHTFEDYKKVCEMLTG